MAKFCAFCGRPLEDGEICGCVPPQDDRQHSGEPYSASSEPGYQPGNPQHENPPYDTFAPYDGQPQDPYQYGDIQGGYYPPSFDNPRTRLIRVMGASRQFLAAVILFTLNVVFSVAQIFVGSGDVVGAYRDLFKAVGIDDMSRLDDLYTIGGGGLNGMSQVSSLIGLVMPILIVVGLWMFYYSSVGAGKGYAAGLPMIKVVSIIQYSIVLFGAGLAEIALIVMTAVFRRPGYGQNIFGVGNGNFSGILSNIFLAFAIVLAVIIVMLAIYLAALIKTINTVITAYYPDRPSGRVSMFLVVMNYISAIFAAISAITGLFGGVHTIFNSLAGFCGSAALIIVSIGISNFKRQYEALER